MLGILRTEMSTVHLNHTAPRFKHVYQPKISVWNSKPCSKLRLEAWSISGAGPQTMTPTSANSSRSSWNSAGRSGRLRWIRPRVWSTASLAPSTAGFGLRLLCSESRNTLLGLALLMAKNSSGNRQSTPSSAAVHTKCTRLGIGRDAIARAWSSARIECIGVTPIPPARSNTHSRLPKRPGRPYAASTRISVDEQRPASVFKRLVKVPGPYILLTACYILCPVCDTMCPVCFVLHPVCCILQPVCYMLQPVCYMLQPVCYMLYPVCHIMYTVCYITMSLMWNDTDAELGADEIVKGCHSCCERTGTLSHAYCPAKY